jgi:GTP-binding protein Era
MTQRCGFVAVVGAPNAGKSTLVNALVGQKVAIVSPKAQTTRTRLMGVAMDGDAQIVLIDTPGIFAPTRRLDRAMVAAAWGSLEEAEAILVMVDAAAKLTGRVERVLEGIANRPEKKYLILNKVDLTKKDKLLTIATELNAKVAFDETYFISASSGDGVAELKANLAALMPEGPWHFPRMKSATPPNACSRPRSRANSSIASSTKNCPISRPSRPSCSRCVPTAAPRSTSRYSSRATISAQSCWARAAAGSRKSARARARS